MGRRKGPQKEADGQPLQPSPASNGAVDVGWTWTLRFTALFSRYNHWQEERLNHDGLKF